MLIGFCCTGNTCRSPMAEFIMKDALKKRGLSGINVVSFGIYAGGSAPMSENARAALESMNIPYENRKSLQLDREIFDRCDYIFAMTEGHKTAIESAYGKAADKLYTLSEAADMSGGISDPFGGNRADYTRAAREIAIRVEAIADKLKEMCE